MWIIIILFFVLLIRTLRSGNLFRAFECNMTLGSWRIYVINDEWECKQACNILKEECRDLSVLGFDCEWVTNQKQRPVALLQLASPGGMCGLFRLNMLKKIPTELKELLSDTSIIKLGVTPLNDALLLEKDYNALVCTTLDLRHLYPTATGLASLADFVLGVKLNKSMWISCSDWESPELTEAQIKYAAQDAFVAVEIFKEWLSSKKDMPYNLKYRNPCTEKEKTKIYPESHIYKSYEKEVPAARKSPLYDNCFMNAPDGRLLCSCDKKKAQWYIDRGLAKVLTCEPYTIELLFEPAARGDESSDGEYYRQLKQNRCVVCGASESYLKHYVVPREYRKHFPRYMKDHQSHDIVLMCVKCHYLANKYNEDLKKKLAVYYNAPIQGARDMNNKLKRIKNCAKALIEADTALPQKRKYELENEIKQFYGVDTFSQRLLDKAIHSKSEISNDNINSHGIKVVNYFKNSANGLQNLEILWRKHFLDTMHPKYLPTLWSVTHNHSQRTK